MTSHRKEKKETILIVEDDRAICEMLGKVLSKQGYCTLKAENGKQEIRMATDNRLDLVVLDLNLPDIEGIHVLKQVKTQNRSTQVIVLTGHGSRETARSAMEIGAFDFLTKPFDVHDVCDVIKEALTSLPAVV
jgi:DNA-binding NtrC family response regulator